MRFHHGRGPLVAAGGGGDQGAMDGGPSEVARLTLDRYVPAEILGRRRGGMSFGSTEDQLSGKCCTPRTERRGGISYQPTDKKALYVRMLGDVKTQTKPELRKEHKNVRRKSGSLQSEANLLDRLDCSSAAKRARLTQRRLSCSSNGGGGGGGGTNTGGPGRTKRPSALAAMSRDSANLLDVQYMTLATKCMSSIQKWDFNVFTLDLLTDGRSLFHLSLHLFFNCGFIEVFHLDVVLLMRCLTLIESGYYFSNPYHNSVHAADVVQAMYCTLQEPRISKHLKPVEKMAAILAAASHDIDHPGVNQSFLIATSNPLAALYNNISVLENHHWHAMIGILHESRVFEHVDRNTWNELLTLTQCLILATDITRQQEILGSFREHLDKGSLDLQSSSPHRSFILQIMLKCSDICNPCRPWSLSKRWSEMICEEFFRQGDCERKLGLPVAPFYDRHKSTVSTTQTGFIANVVEPLFLEWNRFLGSALTELQLGNLRFNRSKWEDVVTQEKLQAQTVTVIVCAESVTSAPVEVHRGVQDVVVDLGASNLNDLVADDKENANPVLNDSNLVDILARRFGRNNRRRHSLPSDDVSDEPVSSAYRSATQSRRHSLPDCERNGENCPSLSTVRRLSSLVECSPVGDDHFDYDNNSNLHRVLCAKNSENCSLKIENPELFGRRRSEIVQTGHLFPEDIDANRRRASCPLNVVNRISCVTSSGKIPSSRETCCPLQQQQQQQPYSAATPPCRLPLSNKRVSECSGKLRKFSLTSFDDAQRCTAANANRKRSRSLATSTLLYPVDENLSCLRSLIANAARDSLFWLQPGKFVGLGVHDSLLEGCQADDHINHFITSIKLPKPPVLSVVTNTRCPAENSSGIDVYSSDRVVPPSVKVTQGQTFQVLSSRPVISRTVDIHSRPPKGVTRKAALVFSSVSSDSEAVPLLPKRVDLHSCDDEI